MATRTNYLTKVVTTPVPQNEPYDSRMVKNNAGGFTYSVDKWQYLKRFLILGAEGGTYYVTERDLVTKNLKNVRACIAEDGQRVVSTIVEFSNKDASPKPDALLFTLALCMTEGDLETRRVAGNSVNAVCNTGYKLQKLVGFVDALGGWGRSKRTAIANWFTTKPVKDVAFQVAKYQNRDGWSMRDILRLTHPKTSSESLNNVFSWVVKGEEFGDLLDGYDSPYPTITGMEKLKREFAGGASVSQCLKTIKEYRLPRECIPTELLAKKEVQTLLLDGTPFTALIRNLGNFSRSGALNDNNSFEVAQKIRDGVAKARVHPVAILGALKVYQSGHGVRSQNTWPVYQHVVDALDYAFYESFKNLETTNKRLLVAIDVSGSMRNATANGMPFLRVNEAAGAMAMATLKVAPNSTVIFFDHDGGYGSNSKKNVVIPGVYVPNISSRQRLDDIVREIDSYGGGGTDCALPVLYAMSKGINVDMFVLFSDNETWSGSRHNVDVLKEYRSKINKNAKMVFVAMSATNFSVGDPSDSLSLEVVGFDPTVPSVISMFSNEEL